MLLRKFYHKLKYLSIKREIIKNCIVEGIQQYGEHSNVILQDGAKKEQIVLKENTWMLGNILVQHKGTVVMEKNSKIGYNSSILCVNSIKIGAYTAIADNTTICDNNNHPVSPSYRRKMRLTDARHQMRTWKYSANAPIIIGENCWIGSNVRICKGVTIGDNSVIAACSVVTKDIPANSIAAGNPAKIVKTDIDKIPEPEFP